LLSRGVLQSLLEKVTNSEKNPLVKEKGYAITGGKKKGLSSKWVNIRSSPVKSWQCRKDSRNRGGGRPLFRIQKGVHHMKKWTKSGKNKGILLSCKGVGSRFNRWKKR